MTDVSENIENLNQTVSAEDKKVDEVVIEKDQGVTNGNDGDKIEKEEDKKESNGNKKENKEDEKETDGDKKDNNGDKKENDGDKNVGIS